MKQLLLFGLPLLMISCTISQSEDQAATSVDYQQQAQELAHRYIITDGHVDLPYRLNEKMEDVSVRTAAGNFDYIRAKEGGLDAPFMSIYVPSSYQETGGAKEFADSMISIVETLTRSHPDKFGLATNPEEVMTLVEKGLIAFPMGMENGAPIENDISNVQYFYDRGIRYITLTHAKDNQICDSSYDTTRTWNGLSPFGREVVQAMNRTGIMVDISHVSDSAFYQVMQLTQAPAIASHSSCRYFTPGFERNMSDDMIKELAKNGGVIQINFGSTFLDSISAKSDEAINAHLEEWMDEHHLGEDDSLTQAYDTQYTSDNFTFSSVKKVADHIDHVVALTSVDHVAFGSDFDGVGDSLPEGLKDVSQFPNVIEELLVRGYSEEDIAKICYKNVFRVWRQVTKTADRLQ